jgi:hypothetical protein
VAKIQANQRVLVVFYTIFFCRFQKEEFKKKAIPKKGIADVQLILNGCS